MGRGHRIIGIVALIVLGVLVLPLLLIAGALSIARTSWGAEQIRRLALPRVNATLAGRIEVRQLAFSGSEITLAGLALRDPRGNLVAEVERLDVHFSPIGLLHRRLRLVSVGIEHPILLIRQARDGVSNLARALASKNPNQAAGAPGRASPDKGWQISLDELTLAEGEVDLRDEGAQASRFSRVHLARINVRASGQYGGHGERKLETWALVQGELSEPVRAPLRLAVSGTGSLDRARVAAQAHIEIELGDSELRLAGQFRKAQPAAAKPTIDAVVAIERIEIGPELGRLLLSTSAIKAAIVAGGRAAWNSEQEQLSATLELAAGGARLALDAAFDTQRLSLSRLSARGQAIDLSRLLRAGPSSDLSFDLEAHGRGRSLATLQGAVTLDVPPGRLGGYPLGPVRVRAAGERGNYRILDLVAELPGLRITGAGQLTAEKIGFHGAVDLRDLGTAARSALALQPGAAQPSRHAGRHGSSSRLARSKEGRWSGVSRATGRGHIEVVASGTLLRPSLRANGQLADLSWQDYRLPALLLAVDVPDLRKPLASAVSLRMAELAIGVHRWRGVVVALKANGPRLDASLALAAPEAIRLTAGGVWNHAHSEVVLHRLTLVLPRVTWNLARRARLSLAEGRTRLLGLDLRAAGQQELRLDLETRGRELAADLTVSALALKDLPQSWLPSQAELAGQVDADIHARGPIADPQVDARVTLARGTIGHLREVAFDTTVHLADHRVSGQVALSALDASLAGHFDLPVGWPPPARAMLNASLTASHLDLQRIATEIGLAGKSRAAPIEVSAVRRMDLRGQGSLHLQVHGTGASPELTVDASVAQLQVNGLLFGDVSLNIDAASANPIAARIELRPTAGAAEGATRQTPGLAARLTNPDRASMGTGFVAVRTGFTLGSLIEHSPSRDRLMSTAMHVEIQVDDVPLAPLAALARFPERPLGTIALHGVLDGTPSVARGNLRLMASAVSSGGIPPTDLLADFQLGDHDQHADIRIIRRGATLLALQAQVGAPLFSFQRRSWWPGIPVELHAALGPLDFQRNGLSPESDRHQARTLQGRIHAQVDMTGTLGQPRLNARADATDIRMDDAPLGTGSASLTYADEKLRADVRLISENGGHLHAQGATTANLGFPAITRGVPVQRLSLSGRLDAQDFDLAGFSGAMPGLRSVGGQLAAALHLAGTLDDPQLSGHLEWKHGQLTITGMGQYDDVHLLVRGDNDHVVLEELKADSGDGHARVTGKGGHQVGSGYAINAEIALSKFPIYGQGQALATISLKASAQTQVTLRHVAAKVSVKSARVELSDAKPKQLQPLARPADVILVEDGSPLNRAQERKLAAVSARLGLHPEQAASASPPQAASPSAVKIGSSTQPAVTVAMTAERDFWVRGKDANIELALQPGFHVEIGRRIRVFGQVLIKRGLVSALGQRFDLKEDSSLRFGGPADTPELDVTATYTDRQDNITVVVTLSGTPGHVQVAVSAPDRPDLTESELYTLIITGRLNFGGNSTTGASTPTNRAASLLGGLLVGQLQTALSKRLPFDVLTIESGNTLGAARIEAGSYVTRKLYVGYVSLLGPDDPSQPQNHNAVHLEYDLTSRWSFQGEYGDAKTGSADLMWTKHY